jgi:hypothetical protein
MRKATRLITWPTRWYKSVAPDRIWREGNQIYSRQWGLLQYFFRKWTQLDNGLIVLQVTHDSEPAWTITNSDSPPDLTWFHRVRQSFKVILEWKERGEIVVSVPVLHDLLGTTLLSKKRPSPISHTHEANKRMTRVTQDGALCLESSALKKGTVFFARTEQNLL